MDTEPSLKTRQALRPEMRPMRVWRVAALAAATLLGGCALNGDFGRLRPDLVTDDMHAWVGRDAVRSIKEKPSEFPLTDNERLLRDLGYTLIQPSYDRNRWDSAFAEYGLEGPRDGGPFDRAAYWTHLNIAWRSSEVSSYAQIVEDARNDVVRLEPFFATAARVVEVDHRRAETLGHVASRAAVRDQETSNALRRINENTAVVEWVCRSLKQRAVSYRYALDRLVIRTPSSNAADVEVALALLATRIGGYCAAGPRAIVAKG
jgi:hypothetical protein